jgi:3-oxoacyl-[acyl-carrier protein] reductase
MTDSSRRRVALVIGASSALGAAAAEALAGGCAAVAVHYHSRRAAADRTAAAVRAAGAEAWTLRADLLKDSGPAAAIERVRRRLGRIDILVQALGPFLQKPWDRLTPSDWLAAYRSNLVAAHGCLMAVLPGMRRRRFGRIIFFGYGRAEQAVAFPGILPYAAAKSGLLLLTRTAAAAEAPRGITVNIVSPGLVTTGIRPRGLDPSKHPLATPRDVGEAVRFLASEAAARITGSNLVVGGTWKM